MKNNNLIPVYFGVAVAIGIVIGSFLNFKDTAVSVFTSSPEESKIKKLINYIQYDYVDEVNTDELLDGAINQIVGKLDPHSVYFTRKQLKLENEKMQGNFVGVGVQFRIFKDSVVVVKVIEGGPSKKIGLKAGDRILMANKDTLSGVQINNKGVISILKGEPDTEVDLTIYRRSSDTVAHYLLKRGEVPIKSVSAHFMINDSIGYIKLERFALTSYDEFKLSLDDLIAKGMKTLVFDLRDNGGGFMSVANKIVDEFLKKDKLIVFTKNKKGDIKEDFATSKGVFENNEVYVLINENSASASEIVAGALQDNDRGTIIGRRSFGKGLVQQTMGLGDGSAIRLTVARYYTPTGRSIQKPYDLSKGEEYYAHFEERYSNGELVSADSIKVNDSLRFKTPKGKLVYGGGGIVPDIFVGIDTTKSILNRYALKMNDFAFEYVDNHRNEFKDISIDSFVKNFDTDERILDLYLEELDLSEPVSNNVKERIQYYLKTRFAYNIFDYNGFYEVITQDDLMIDKVNEIEKENLIIVGNQLVE
ncbi:MAG: PDZ domain-containing protein [Flavobacteriaceae bacterium]|nr:PDZ domain-containing protein [Flavobacteriaceae bacterium]